MRTFILIIIILLQYDLISQCEFNNVRFNLTYEDEDFLRYVYIQNDFETCYVSYKLGEVQVFNDSLIKDVILNSLFANEKYVDGIKSIQGMDDIGVDTVISKKASYRLFKAPQNGKIRFVRFLDAAAKCNSSDINLDDPWDHNDIEPIGTDDIYWTVGRDVVSDEQEFIIELLNTSGETVQVIDSVGIKQNLHDIWATGYGTDVKQLQRIVDIDSNLWGDLLILRVKTKRFGNTNYGMLFKVQYEFANVSSYIDVDANGKTFIPGGDSCYHQLFNEFYIAVNNYLDSSIAITGKIPNINRAWTFYDHDKDYTFKNKYYEPVIENDDTLYYKTRENFSNSKTRRINSRLNSKDFTVSALYPNPIAENRFTIEYISNEMLENGEIVLMDISGKTFGTLYKGSFQHGKNLLELQIKQKISSGKYYLMFYNNNDFEDNFLCLEKLIVE